MPLFGGTRTKSFDFIKFFVIFLLWILGSWVIIQQVDKIDREGSFMFSDKNYRITEIRMEEVEGENEDENTGSSEDKILKKSLRLELE